MAWHKLMALFPAVFILGCTTSESGWVSALGPEADVPVVERGVIDHRIEYIKEYRSVGDDLANLQHYGEMLLVICKRAEQRRQTDYLVERLYAESGNRNLMNVLLYLKRGKMDSRKSEVYKMFQKLESYPGMKEKLAL